jgi:hypothetical protein
MTLNPAQLGLDETLSAAAASGGSSYIDTRGWFCDQDVCPVVVGNTIVYFDNGGHITTTYATALSQVFRHAFMNAIRGSATTIRSSR